MERATSSRRGCATSAVRRRTCRHRTLRRTFIDLARGDWKCSSFVLLLSRNKKKKKKERRKFSDTKLRTKRASAEEVTRQVDAARPFEGMAHFRRPGSWRRSRGPLSPSLDAGKGSPPLADRRRPPTRRSLRREDGQSRRGSRRRRRKKIAIIAQHFLYIGCVAVTWLNLSV